MRKGVVSVALLVGPLVAVAGLLIAFGTPIDAEDIPSIMPPGSKLAPYEAAVGANGVVPRITLDRSVRVVVIGDDTMTPTRSAQAEADSARRSSAPFHLRASLTKEGYHAALGEPTTPDKAPTFHIINQAIDDTAIADWLARPQPAGADVTVISVGSKDLRQGGAGTSVEQFTDRLGKLIDRAQRAGSVVVLVLPMPIDDDLEDTFTQDELLRAYLDVALPRGVEVIRTDLLLGKWSHAQDAGKTIDQTHWTAWAGTELGKAMTPHVVRAVDWKLHPAVYKATDVYERAQDAKAAEN